MLSILAEREFPIGEVDRAGQRAFGRRAGRLRQPRDSSCSDLAHLRPGRRRHRVVLGRRRRSRRNTRRSSPRPAPSSSTTPRRSATTTTCRWWCREVNPEAVNNSPRGIIANPNCSTMQMLVALAPIHRAVGIERINVATYQSVSGAGRSGARGTGPADRARCSTSRTPEPQTFPVQIAFNLIPHIDDFHGQRLHQGRDEAGLGDAQDPRRRQHPGEPDRGARAGVLRPFRGRAHRDPQEDHRRRGPRAARDRRRAWWWSTSASPAATRPR